MSGLTTDDRMRDETGRGLKLKTENRSGRARSHSMEYVNGGLEFWDTSAGGSKPVRWYPSHLSHENQLRHSKSACNFQGLETIDEDMPAQGRLDQLRINKRLHYMLYNYDDNANRRQSDETNTFISTQRRHSDSDILDGPSPNRYNKRRQPANNGNKRNSNPEIRKPERSRNARKKSYVGVELSPDYDTFSDVSDAHSQKSAKSRLSVGSDDSLSSASKLAARRRKEADGLSAGNISKASSMASLVQHEAKGKQGSVNEGASNIDTSSNISNNNNNDSSKPQPKRHLLALSVGSEDPSPFSTLEIPLEFLNSPTSRVRKWMAPIVIFLVAGALLACLTAAVYFAVVLKDSQERQIEVLQVTLRFALARDQQSREIGRLTSSELSELKRAYCQQVDDIYKTSIFTANYRGCEVETLTSEKIQFKLYFLDGSVPEKQQEDNIVEVLELRAQSVGVEGSQLRKISDITFDISNKTRSVQIQKTRKAEDFFSTSSPNLTNTRSSVKANSSFVRIDGDSKDDVIVTIVPTSTSTSISISATTDATTTTTSYSTTAITSNPANIYNDEDNKVFIDTICSTLDPTELVAHPVDCTHYIQCEFMKPIIRPCSGGLVFDPTLKTCVKPSPDTPCTSLKPCENINGGYFGHPTNCKFFIICDRGRTVVQSCKNNFMWDDISKTCVVARNGSECAGN